jgi:threonine dehydrogenase-like Zn-dependent dehydrogenase
VRWSDEGLVVDPDVPEPTAGDAADEVVLDVAAVGICGTDLHFLRDTGARHVLGHEISGTVHGVGHAVEPTVFCGRCVECCSGSTQRCTEGRRNIGVSCDGGLADRVALPHYALVPLPDGLDVRDACLVEPASVAWHGIRRAGLEPGQPVAVVGGGAIGLLAAASAVHLGHDAVVEARHPHQRAAAERLGAGAVPAAGTYDVVVDAAGTPEALARCAALVRPGGRVVVLGVSTGLLPVPGVDTLVKEITWVGSMGRGRHDGVRESDEVAAMLAARPEVAATVITHHFALDDAVEAFRVAGDKTSGAIKVVLHP